MNRSLCSSIIIFFLLLSLESYAAKKSAAVMNFTNYGGRGIRYLSKAIPESISTALAEKGTLRIVERRQLGKIINEISLEQSGLVDTKNLNRAGRLTRANFLILGSISGKPDRIILTMKAVEVKSGRIITGMTIKSPLSELFERANRAAESMAAVISGRGIGKLSVSSNPSGSDVYLDGMMIGKTPVVQYRVTAGTHSVKIIKEGYMEYEDEIKVLKKEHQRLNPVLGENIVQNRTEFGAGVMYFSPFKSYIKGSPYYLFFAGHSFGRFIASLEFAYSQPDHTMSLINPFGGTFEQNRWYDVFSFQGHFSFIPFPSWRYFSPYAGLCMGLTHMIDYRKNEALENDREELSKSSLFAIGAKIGANILPFSFISLFAECRLIIHPQPLTRYTFQSQGIGGEMAKIKDDIHMHYWSIGGGVKLYF